MTYHAATPEALDPIARDLLRDYPQGIVVLLKGNLGAGKSTFVGRFTAIMAPEATTTSPTFSVMHEYAEGIYHYDIYRIGSEDFIARGLHENLESPGFHFLEWADERIERLLEESGIPYITLEITQDKEKRTIHVRT